jgi:DNA-binding MarR family transcriptional regulator
MESSAFIHLASMLYLLHIQDSINKEVVQMHCNYKGLYMTMQVSVKQERLEDGFTPIQGPAWAGFLRMQASLLRTLNAEMQANHQITLSEYEVLLFLACAPQFRLSISVLASSVLLSLSGTSRLIDRLERAGYVEREVSTYNARISNVVLTPEGWQQWRTSQPTHLNGVRQHFLSHFSNEELLLLARFWKRFEPAQTQDESKDEQQNETNNETTIAQKVLRGRGRPRKGGAGSHLRRGIEVTFDIKTIALLDTITDNRSSYLEELVLDRLREQHPPTEDRQQEGLEEFYKHFPQEVVEKLQELASLAGVAAARKASEAIMLLLEQRRKET